MQLYTAFQKIDQVLKQMLAMTLQGETVWLAKLGLSVSVGTCVCLMLGLMRRNILEGTAAESVSREDEGNDSATASNITRSATCVLPMYRLGKSWNSQGRMDKGNITLCSTAT